MAIREAMGHGLEATLLAAVALSTMGSSRRCGYDLTTTVLSMDAAVSSQFGPARFLTGIVGELHVSTGSSSAASGSRTSSPARPPVTDRSR